VRDVPERVAGFVELGLQQADHRPRAAGQADQARQIDRVELAAQVGRADADTDIADRAGGVVEP